MADSMRSGWVNLGDVNPKEGTFLIRNPHVIDGDFTCDVVKVIPETDVGGSDRVFDLVQGSLYLGRKTWQSALQAVGAELRADGAIVRPGHQGECDLFAGGTDQFLIELAHATMAYCGPEVESSTLVGIGLPQVYDADPKFDGELTLFPERTPLWSIMRGVFDGFDYRSSADDDGARAVSLDTEDGPYAGTPRVISGMADLIKIAAFRDLGLSQDDEPLVWEHSYRVADDRVVTQSSAHEIDVYDPGYDLEEDAPLQPFNTRWVGPEQQDLCELWEAFYVDRRPAAPGPIETHDDEPHRHDDEPGMGL